MDTVESLGYLKGLIDGLEIDENSKDGKIFKAILEVLDNIVDDIDDLAEEVEDLEEELDDLEDDVCDLEDCVYDDDDDDDWDEYDEEYEEYEVECPSCGTAFDVDEDTLLGGTVECPSCGETLEFQFEAEEDDVDEIDDED